MKSIKELKRLCNLNRLSEFTHVPIDKIEKDIKSCTETPSYFYRAMYYGV
uniref:Uncharacterized protein n=1 Tax=Dulem virus 42 TaxID=3145760 RepID=A0AAU8B8W9_9CAUD